MREKKTDEVHLQQTLQDLGQFFLTRLFEHLLFLANCSHLERVSLQSPVIVSKHKEKITYNMSLVFLVKTNREDHV